MALPIKKGKDDPLLQFWEQSWSPSQGNNGSFEYKGINLAKMSALAAYYASIGYPQGTLRFEKDVATLTVKSTDGGVPGGVAPPTSSIIDKWEVAVDDESPSLFGNSNFLGIVQAGDGTPSIDLKSKQIMRQIKLAADNGTTWADFYKAGLASGSLKDNSGNDITTGGLTLLSGINAIGSHPNLKDFFDDYVDGRTNYIHGKYNLRHTTFAPANYATNVADFNVEQIYSIAQLLSEAQNGALWILPLPPYLAYKILNYPVPINQRTNYTWGALKKRSPSVTAAQGRIEISTEYLIDSIAIHTYGLI